MNKDMQVADEQEKQDAYYSEELSRAAVGRLFDEGEEAEDGPPPIKSAFVTGFDRPQGRDRNPTKRRERVVESQDRFRPPQEDFEEEKPAREPREKREPRESREIREPREREHNEPTADRHKRRETATTRLLNGAPPEDSYDAERRERRERRRNPAPKPAVRVNVPKERQIHENDPRNAPPNEQPDDGELDSFRRRYNSDELFSPPRNPNRPVRAGRSDVRTNRQRVSDRDMETISPLRLILAITAILVLALIAILTVQMISFRNRYNEAQYELIAARVAVNDAYADAHILNQDLQYALTNAERENADLERLLRDLGHDPNQPAPPPDDGTRPGAGNETPQQTTPPPPEIPTLPTTHIVAPGENLFRIAQRYFGNQYQSTVNHIQTVNNITDPDRIRAGDVLQITPMS